VIPVRVVEHGADGEVDVVAVGDRRMAARRVVTLGALDRRADAGPAAVDVERVLVGVPLVRGVEVPVVEVVGVVSVLHGAVPAIGTVTVRVVAVLGARHRGDRPSGEGGRQAGAADCAEWRPR